MFAIRHSTESEWRDNDATMVIAERADGPQGYRGGVLMTPREAREVYEQLGRLLEEEAKRDER